jgi:hypothetical protein
MNEQELLEHLKETTVPNLERMEYGFSHWDCTAWYDTPMGRVDFILELKCRETHYPELLIEQVKWDWLLEEAGKRSARPAYINSTPRGIYAWDLYRVKEPIWEERILPATTTFENRDQIRKVVGFLPITEAMVLS